MVEVLYEDNHLLILNKPAGLLTQPEQESASLMTQAKAYVKEKYSKPGAVFLHPAHRLDRVTSGIVVFARTSKALSRLNASIREGQWKKSYKACVLLMQKSTLDFHCSHWTTLDDYLIKVGQASQTTSSKTAGGKRARLHYSCAKAEKGVGLLYVQLETGRYHQIRAQLSARGAPILGDIKYGAPKAKKHAIALHHSDLVLEHPVQKKCFEIHAPVQSNPYSELELF